MALKIATIGITINLENYENLRLEVQGEVGEDGNTEELVAFLDGMLARLGHGDEATAERVEAYRRRVLAMPRSVAAPPGPARGVEKAPAEAARLAPAGPPAGQVRELRESPPPEARPETQLPSDGRPVTIRVTPEGKAAKPATKAPTRTEGPAGPAAAPAPARMAEHRKAQASQPPKEPAKPEKPVIAEGEVPCEGCGLSITKNQEKLSRLLTGKSLCKRCMNP